MLRSFFKSGAILGSLHLSAAGLTFGSGIVLTQSLGATGYGAYAVALSWATLLGMLVQFGLPVLALREFSAVKVEANWEAAKGLTRFATAVVLILALSIFLIVSVRQLFSGESDPLLMTALLLMPILAVARLKSLSLHGLGFTFWGNFPLLVARPGIFLLLLGCSLGFGVTLNPLHVMSLNVVAACVVVAVLVAAFQASVQPSYHRVSPRFEYKSWLSACVPLGLTEGLRSVQAQVAILLLASYVVESEVGVYKVAQSTLTLALMATNVVNMTLAPVASRLKSENNIPGLQRVAATCSWVMVSISILPLLVMYFFGEYLFATIFGSDFRGANRIFLVVLSTYSLSYCFGPAAMVANMVGYEKYVTTGLCLSVGAQVGITVLLMPKWGVLAAAIGVGTGTCLSTSFLSLVLIRQAKLNPTILGVFKDRSCPSFHES